MMSYVHILLLLSFFRVLRAQDVPADISQSLMVLLDEETKIHTQLEQELSELGKELAILRDLNNNVSCACPWHTHPVAFSATLTQDIANLGVRQQISFDKVITNLGNGYDTRHGEFRAPVTGTYEFSVSMLMKPGQWSGLEVVRDGIAIGKIRTGDASEWTMAATSVTAQLNAGQDVWVEHVTESDSNTVYGELFSTFSGHLIQP